MKEKNESEFAQSCPTLSDPIASVSNGVMYFLISYYNESKECPEVVKTHSHNLHFKITGLARRFFPETVLKQDTLLLYNPKECRKKKKFVLSSSLRIPDPSLLGDPWTSYQPA